MGKTALIILNYNNSADTRNCLASILEHNSAPAKIVVVDNCSRPDEQLRLREAMAEVCPGYAYYADAAQAPDVMPAVSLIESGENMGYARGNNVGLRAVERDGEVDHVMILNNDILFVADIIPSLLRELERRPDCAVISPVLYKKGMAELDLNCARRNVSVGHLVKRNFLHYYYRWRGLSEIDMEAPRFLLLGHEGEQGVIGIELPSGSCMLMRKDLFKQLGYFDPATFLYFEENILYKKIEKLGLKNCLSLSDKCVHLGASTTAAIPDNKWLMRQSKDSERYYVRAYSGASPLLKALHSLSVKFAMAAYSLQKSLQRKNN